MRTRDGATRLAKAGDTSSADLAPGRRVRPDVREDRGPWVEAIVLLLIGALLSLDLASDVESGHARLHVVLELSAACAAVCGLGWVSVDWWRVRRRLQRRLDDLERQVESAGVATVDEVAARPSEACVAEPRDDGTASPRIPFA
jgi:hypothetical protein